MTKMARIEVILFLREVELFHFCTAEEILRISAIISERHYLAGQTVYEHKQAADDLFCIASGSIQLAHDDDEKQCLGPGEAFGYLEILSGRRRDHQAVALEDTRVLAIDEEDFFDLLSNNIDIVKSLFRHMANLFLDKEQRSATP